MESIKTYRDKENEKWVGLGVEHPKLHGNVGVTFRSAVVMGNVDFLFTIGEKYHRPHSDTIDSPKNVPVWNFKSFRELLNNAPLNCEIVGVELDDRSKDLETFVWPKRSIVVLGSEGNGLSKQARESCRHLVKIPSSSRISYNVSSAASIILYDLFLKGFKGIN